MAASFYLGYMAYQNTIARIRNGLVETFTRIDSCFDLPIDNRQYHPSADVWSIDEILEHITLTNHYLMLTLRASCRKALRRAQTTNIPDGESDLDRIVKISNPDAFAWIRPEHMEPTYTKSSDEVRLIMRHQYHECLVLLNSVANGEGTLHKVRMSVQNLGKLDVYE
jgi:hypothetical protein